MKKTLYTLCLFILLGCTTKTEMFDLSSSQLIGSTYSGYSFTSGGIKVFDGYRFTSVSKAQNLVLDENMKIIASYEISYSGHYPNFTIGGFPAICQGDSLLVIRSIKMKRW